MKHSWSARCLLALLALPLASACDSSPNPPPTTEDKAAPTTRATPAGGQYASSVTVSLLCDDAGGSGCAATHYTLDGSEPTTASPAFRDAIALGADTPLKFFSVDKAGNAEAVHTEQYTIGDTLAPTTTASPAGGAFNSARQVTLTCSDGNGSGCAATYFTLDGSTPTAQSSRYASPIPLTASTTLRFFSVDKQDNAEAVRTEAYTFDATPPTVAASLPGDVYGSAKTVALSCDDGGSGCAALHYTTDGSAPTVTSPVYAAPLSIAATTTLRFFAVDRAGNASPLATERYVIDTTGPSTAAVPGSGVFNYTFNVTLSCDDAGGSGCEATYYTTDGTAPTQASRRYSAPVAVTSTTTLRFFSVDKAGHEGPRGTETYTLDFIAPTTTATPPGGNHGASVQVTLSCEDTGGSGCEASYYATDASLPTSSYTRYTQPVTLTASGSLKFFSVDKAGNREDVRTRTYTLDATPPTTTATPKGGTYNQTQQVAFSCSDGVGTGCAATHYTTDGSTPTRSSPSLPAGQTLPISRDTALQFFSVDAADNAEPVKTETYVIDTTPPATTATPPGGVYRTSQSVTLACADGAGTGCKATYYTVDGTVPSRSSPQYGATPIAVTSSTVLRFFSVDTADNAEPVQVVAYTLDTVAPTASASPKGGPVRAPVEVSLACEDTGGSGCEALFYTLDGSEPNASSTRYTGPFTVNFTRTVRFFARDVAGNTSGIINETYLFDTTAPTVAADPAGRVSNAPLTVTLTCDDGEAPCKAIHYTLDGSTPDVATSSQYTGPLSISATTPLKFIGVDAAGNTSAVKAESYLIDTVRPVTTVNPPGGNFTSSPVTVTLSCGDSGGAGCDAIYYTVDGSTPFVTPSQVYSGALTFASSTTLRYFAVDKAGNAEAVQTQAYLLPVTAADTSAQLAAVRAAVDGPLSQPIDKALVTYVKPGVGNLTNDPAGFFLQAERQGPALFVVDPGGLSPAPKPGDRVSLIVTERSTSFGQPRGAAFTDYVVHSSGESVAPLLTDASAVDLVTLLGDYDSEYLSVSGTLTSGFTSSGTSHMQASLSTAGVPSSLSFKLRLTSVALATLQQLYDLGQGCSVTVTAPLWRYYGTAQPSGWATSDVQVLGCPWPKVVAAVPASNTSVLVRFDRNLDAMSVMALGIQFTFSNGLVAKGATVVSSREVLVNTSAQSTGASYTVTVDSTVRDVMGTSVDPGANSQGFIGYRPPAVLRLNEVAPDLASGRDLVELYVVQGGNTTGMTLEIDGASSPVLATLPDVQVATGDILVVHLNPDKTTQPAQDSPGSETLGKSQYPLGTYAANYDTAWDFHGGSFGIGFLADVVLRVKDAAGTPQDAAAFVHTTWSSANFPALLQAIQAEGLWQPADCNGAPCTYSSIPSVADVSVDWTSASPSIVDSTRGGPTVYRVGNMDTDRASDWTTGPISQGQDNSLGLPNP